MKKLSIIIAAGSLALATPVFACPGHDSNETKTAEKAPAPKQEEPKKEEPKKEAPKAKEGTTTAKAKETPKKEEPKKPTKVSQK
jgi:hypothetical protein